MNVISTFKIKPDRMVFYVEASQSDIEKYYEGVIPEEVARYSGAFGTYGTPTLILLKEGDSYHKIIGIEYRPDDSRIEYPKELKSLLLPKKFFRSELIMEDYVNEEMVLGHVQQLCQEEAYIKTHLFGKVFVRKEQQIMQVYIANGQIRVLVDSDYTRNYEKEDLTQYKTLYYRDSTTGGANWNYFWERMAGYTDYGIQDFALAYFDIKDFKAINIVYGHLAANRLLASIDQKMNELDWVYFCARCDNDNFAMMIKDMSEEETTLRLQEFFESVSHIDMDDDYKVYYRCGVVPMRTTIEMGSIVADAGKQAKAFGTKPYKNEVIFFTDEMRERQNRNTRLRIYLDTAIRQDEFLVYFQPKFDVDGKNIKGSEALIRWKYKGREMLSPGMFIPMFEEGGQISKLDDIVLNKVCRHLNEWKAQGKKIYPVSVNISRKSVGIPGLVDRLTEIVDSYGVDHALIDFELTESAANDNQELMLQVISSLKDKGFKLSVDDFGTGYSSLSLLPIMRFDTLKIDKSFVDRIGMTSECTRSNAIIKHIISLAKDINLTCLAEGAETKEQVDLLRAYGCEVIQGFYFSRPLPVEEYEKYL